MKPRGTLFIILNSDLDNIPMKSDVLIELDLSVSSTVLGFSPGAARLLISIRSPRITKKFGKYLKNKTVAIRNWRSEEYLMCGSVFPLISFTGFVDVEERALPWVSCQFVSPSSQGRIPRLHSRPVDTQQNPVLPAGVRSAPSEWISRSE